MFNAGMKILHTIVLRIMNMTYTSDLGKKNTGTYLALANRLKTKVTIAQNLLSVVYIVPSCKAPSPTVTRNVRPHSLCINC